MKIILSIFILMGFTGNVHAQVQTSHIRKANRLYKERKYNEALPEYQKSVEQNAADPIVNYNLGDAYFRMEKYDDAIKAFEKSAGGTLDPSVKERSFYNKGVSYSRENKLDESIAAYKSALIINPNDSDARVNLQKALMEQKKKEQPEKEKKEDEKNKKQQKKDQKEPPPQSKLSKKQVEQLLKALQQREQQVQQKMQQNRTRATNKPDKDW